jgi:hypothetical protein
MRKQNKHTLPPSFSVIALISNVHIAILWTTLFRQVNYQYRNGTSFPVALRTLYNDGGVLRFYRGVLPALVQGPLSRFGDTAANTGMLTLLDSFEATENLNVGVKTVSCSVAAALFRIVRTVHIMEWKHRCSGCNVCWTLPVRSVLVGVFINLQFGFLCLCIAVCALYYINEKIANTCSLVVSILFLYLSIVLDNCYMLLQSF